MDSLDVRQARRIALRAQGFGSMPQGRPGRASLLATVRRLGMLQIDSVNVVVRAQYLPLFSRLGPYDVKLLNRLAYGRSRALFEYWGHEASLLPLETFPLLRWRMQRARRRVGIWRSVAHIAEEQPGIVERIEATIRERGPMAASDFEGARAAGSWWGWSEVKRALEFLFGCGILTTATRRASFERVYDLTERVLPVAAAAPPVDEPTAQQGLMRTAVRAYGIATEADLRDYFRMEVTDARTALAALEAQGLVRRVAVAGWRQPAYLNANHGAAAPIDASALVSPFDPLVWDRGRTRRLFDFDYRLEIYTPSHKRVHGYYVMPYLVGERLVARIDVKADRAHDGLLVHAVHYEDGVDRAAVFERLQADVYRLAAWLGLERIQLPKPGRRS